ncbi:hypothetical protein ACE5IS_19375 [Leptospira wolffii]|uniref:Uncharacterized protein n=1 Tax=Leptospira wolffii TaxID=409998 RepID=A0ABV5BU28_9LEPT
MMKKIILPLLLVISFSVPSEAKSPTALSQNNDPDLSGLYFRIDQNEYGDMNMYLILTKRSDSKYNIDFKFADNGVTLQALSLKCDRRLNCRLVFPSGMVVMNFSLDSKDIVVKISPNDKSEVRNVIENGARFSQDVENKPFQYKPLE